MGHLRKTILASLLLLVACAVATPAAAATFDGAWNVQIASSNIALPERDQRLDRDQQRPGRVR